MSQQFHHCPPRFIVPRQPYPERFYLAERCVLVEAQLLSIPLRIRMRRMYARAQAACVSCVAMDHEPEPKPSGRCLAVSYRCV